MQTRLPFSINLVKLFMVIAFMLMGLTTIPTYAERDSESTDMACTATAHAPYNSGTKVQGRGTTSGCSGSYHTFQVCLVKHNAFSPDQNVQCLSGNGNPPAGELKPTGCLGNAEYFTRVTLDGNTNQSMRVALNCS